MLLLLLMGSMVSFMIITLPPGDYLSYYVDRMTMSGVIVSEEDLAGLRRSTAWTIRSTSSTPSGCSGSSRATSGGRSAGTGRSRS